MNERRGTKGLELWCRKMTEGYPGVKIDNMTTSWRDGLAFCAIIHHFRPDLIDFTKLNKDDVYHNNELAFRVAEQYLGIPALLEPEDMVEYSVPDRLSILTYLSQFYQAFAVREGGSPARIAPKRPQSSTDHGIVSPASTSPPTKVAFTGTGNLRRDPCQKCGLPVFIAERLNIGKHLFHRTCFRCARCNSQLTPVNYYETENGEFCCEICPDEEQIMAKKSAQHSVLLRSMSDEEKTASLKTFNNEPDEFSTMFETALDNVDVEKVHTLSREFDSARATFFQSQVASSDSGSEDKEAEPPDLVESLNPASASEHFDSGFPSKGVSEKTSLSPVVESQNVVTKDANESFVKTRMRLFENNEKADVNSKPVPLSNFTSIPISIKHVDSSNSISDIDDFQNSSLILEDNGNVIKDKLSTQIVTATSQQLHNSDQASDITPNEMISTVKDSSVICISDSSENNESALLDSSVISVSDVSEINQSALVDSSVISISDSMENNSSTIDESIQDINDVIDSLQNSSSFTEDKIQLVDYNTSLSVIEENVETTNDNIEQNLAPLAEIQETPRTIESEKKSEDEFLLLKESMKSTDEIEKSKKPTETINYNVKILAENNENDELKQSLSQKIDENTEIVEAINTPTIHRESLKEASLETVGFPNHKESMNISPRNILEKTESYPENLNPFDDDDNSEEIQTHSKSLNPFGSEDEDDEEIEAILQKPVPIKRKVVSASYCREIMNSPLKEINMERISINPFETNEKPPVPAARKKKISAVNINVNPFSSDDDENEDVLVEHTEPKQRTSSGHTPLKPNLLSPFGGSNSSISSGSYQGSTRKKRPAPKPPIPAFFDDSNSSKASTPCQSVQHSPKSTPKHRKNRKAPPPPKFASTPMSAQIIKNEISMESSKDNLIDEVESKKTVKDEANRNRQSQNMRNPTADEDVNTVANVNKSTYGKWKRKKGQAPTKPVPQRRTIKCLPMSEIKKELEFIEIQQQGLEKQGVRIEQIIREKCEGSGDRVNTSTDDDIPIEVEDLILQLFELVNEKNELFRKQTELMYLRRQQRLEEEHADVEYQIRCLMMQPEANKTDSDKAREEELIKRLVEIVERRNEIIECLEMDRVREAEEDDSITNHINLFTLSRETTEKSKTDKPKKTQDSEKEKKKKEKKEKKSKHKSKEKIDADKDVDTTENMNTLEKKKKKKFNLF